MPGEKKDFVFGQTLREKDGVRTLKVTLCASACGWWVGLVGGTISTAPAWKDSHSVPGALLFVYFLARAVALVMLPVCLFVVAPLVRWLLARSSLWSPAWAAGVGGVAGVLALGAWAGGVCVCMGGNLFETAPMAALLHSLGVVALAVGAATGAGGAWAARLFQTP